MKYRPPLCRAPHVETGRPCGLEMKPMGERHPSFGPNYRPGHWIFQCPRCESVRVVSDENVDRYAQRYK